LLASACLFFSPNIAVILAGRVLSGFSKGLIGVTGQVYGCECLFFDRLYLRESFKIWSGIFISFCIIVFEPFAHFLSYRDIASAAFLLTLLELILVHHFLPESPCWLQYQEQYALEKYKRRYASKVEKSRKALGIPQSVVDDQTTTNGISGAQSFFRKMRREDVYKPLIATTVLLTLTSFVGAIK
jgi:MFS family permease